MRPTWLVIAALVSGCSERAAPSERAPASDALCEHGVQETVCTKHNPRLVAVFKAKGDWCEEHGFALSFCPIHHPERGGRPASDTTDDGAPAHGTKVRFKTADTAANAGIVTVAAELRPGGARLETIASIAYDATRRAVINARAPGVVRALKVDIGARVAPGAALAVIDSAQVSEDRSRLDAATARVLAAESNFTREEALLARGISSARDLEIARQEREEARAARAGAASALGIVGAGRGGNAYTLTSPLAGTVVRRTATIGHMVGLDDALFEIVDTSRMWAELDVPEAQLARVQPGQEVTITVETIADRSFTGVIDYIAPEVDTTTRTAKARVALANPDGVLRANMFARAQIALGAAQPSVMVPTAAVQRVKSVALVFVRLAADQYEARRVTLGLAQGDRIEISEGIVAGEQVATTGSFLLKTETLKGAIGAGCCDGE